MKANRQKDIIHRLKSVVSYSGFENDRYSREIQNPNNKAKERFCFCGVESTLESAEETTVGLERRSSCQMCSVSGYTLSHQ